MAHHDPNDLDSSHKAGHHSLGTKHDQAAAGDHKHGDVNSRLDGLEHPLRLGGSSNALQTLVTATITILTNWAFDASAQFTNAQLVTKWAYAGGVLTIPENGLYRIDVKVSYAFNAAGSRFAYIYKNGNPLAIDSGQAVGAVDPTRQSVWTEENLVAGDTIDFRGLHRAGVNLNVLNGSAETRFQIRKISGTW